jgi:hypothetical protein
LAEIDRDDVRALLRHPDGVATSLPTGGPGDEGDLSLKTSGHDSSSADR